MQTQVSDAGFCDDNGNPSQLFRIAFTCPLKIYYYQETWNLVCTSYAIFYLNRHSCFVQLSPLVPAGIYLIVLENLPTRHLSEKKWVHKKAIQSVANTFFWWTNTNTNIIPKRHIIWILIWILFLTPLVTNMNKKIIWRKKFTNNIRIFKYIWIFENYQKEMKIIWKNYLQIIFKCIRIFEYILVLENYHMLLLPTSLKILDTISKLFWVISSR